MDKRGQRIQQKGSLKHLKRSAPEVKCSWRQSAPRVMTSSEAASSEVVSPEAKWFKILSFKSCFMDRSSSEIGRRLVELCNGHFKRIWRHLGGKIQRALTLYSVRSVQPPSPLLCFVLLLQDKITALKYNHACNNVPSQLEWIWNWSFIGQYLNHARNHWWKIKLQQMILLDVLALTTFKFTSLYKGMNTWRTTRLHNILKAPKLCQIVQHPKVHLEFQFSSSYLRNSKVLRVCIWFVFWTPPIVYQVFKLKHFLCNFVW